MRLVWVVVLCSVLGVVASCSDAVAPSEHNAQPSQSVKGEIDAKQRLAVIAASGVDATYAGEYVFTPSGKGSKTRVSVEKTATALRYSYRVPSTDTTHEFSSTWYVADNRVLQCVSSPSGAGCVKSSDSALRSEVVAAPLLAFTHWLEALAQRSAAVSVEEHKRDNTTNTLCFSVEKLTSSLDAPVGTGEYCFAENGYLTSLSLGSGSLTWHADSELPDTIELPVETRAHLPSVQKPSPTPTPSSSEELIHGEQ